VLDLIGKREKSRGYFAVECLDSQAAHLALNQGQVSRSMSPIMKSAF
jgi:hypothetical protein